MDSYKKTQARIVVGNQMSDLEAIGSWSTISANPRLLSRIIDTLATRLQAFLPLIAHPHRLSLVSKDPLTRAYFNAV